MWKKTENYRIFQKFTGSSPKDEIWNNRVKLTVSDLRFRVIRFGSAQTCYGGGVDG